MEIDFKGQHTTVEFREVKDGDVFTLPGDNTLFLKISEINADEYSNYNAIDLNTKEATLFGFKDNVCKLQSKLTVWY